MLVFHKKGRLCVLYYSFHNLDDNLLMKLQLDVNIILILNLRLFLPHLPWSGLHPCCVHAHWMRAHVLVELQPEEVRLLRFVQEDGEARRQ